MAVSDVQIIRDSPVAVPMNYKLPALQEIQVRAVAALFDGSAAAGSYIPALVIIGQSGTVIARGADPSNVVAAGASAEVSWFPGGGLGGGSTPNVAVFQASLYLTRHAPGTLDPVQTIADNTVTPIAWHGIAETGGGAPGGMVTPTFGATDLSWGEFGDNTVTLSVVWPPGAYDRYIELTITNPVATGTITSPRLRTNVSPDGDTMTLTANITGNPVDPTILTANVYQHSGVSQDVSAEMYLSGSSPEVDLT